MSGVTSTIHDSGRVYLFDRNALPKNFIESGMKMSPSGLAVNISTGTCDIGGKFHELDAQATVSLPQRMASLVYALKSDLTDSPTFGYVQAAFPAADAGTVCRYVITGAATIASSGGTGGGDLTRNGGVTQVDGWIGYAGKGDGSTGYYVSANSTGFPTGAAAGEVEVVFTPVVDGAIQWQIANTNYAFLLGQHSNNNLIIGDNVGSLIDTGYTLETGKTYYVVKQYDGVKDNVFVNGSLIYSATITRNTVAGVLYVGRNVGGTNFSKATFHYVELRNTLRTPAQIAAISNALLLPCRYETSSAISQAAGTNIGDLTSNGGLAASFDGTTSQVFAASSATAAASAIGHIGKNYGTIRPACGFEIRGASDTGLDDTSGATTITLTWQGSNDTTTGLDGTWTDVFSDSFADAPGIVRNYQSLFPGGKLFKCHRIKIQDSGGYRMVCAELTFFESFATHDIRSILPVDAISLGLARTNTSDIIELDESSYKHGRREGAVGGNRRVFLGWKCFDATSADGAVDFTNVPFDTYKVTFRLVYKENIGDAVEVECRPRYYDSTITAYSGAGVARQLPINVIRVAVCKGGVAIINATAKNKGYIGCYAEVIE